MFEEGFCFPADEVIFLMLAGSDQRCSGEGKVAMEMSASGCFVFGGMVVMLKSVGVFSLANAEVEH